MIPTPNRVELLDRCHFNLRRERQAAARLPIANLRQLTEDRERDRGEVDQLVDRDA